MKRSYSFSQGTTQASQSQALAAYDGGRRKQFIPRPMRFIPKGKGKSRVVSMRNIAKQVFNKMTESKYSRYNFQTFPRYYLDVAWQTNNVAPILPYSGFLNCAQGTGQHQRIGNKIRVHQLRMKGVVRMSGYNATVNPTPAPHMVQLWILQDKSNPDALPVALPEFFASNAADTAPSGGLLDYSYDVNEDRWRVAYQRTFKVGFADASGTGTSAANQSYTNNDFQLVIPYDIDLTKCVSPVLSFDDTDNTCNSAKGHFYAVWMIYKADGSAGVTGQSPVICDASLYFKFKDA